MPAPTPPTGEAWDVTSPDEGQVHGNDFQEHQETKLAVQIRNNKEHVAYGPASAGGEHKQGSAVSYIGDYSTSAAGDALPTKRPDGSIDLDESDYGRMAYDTNETYGPQFYVYTSGGWVAAALFPTVLETKIHSEVYSSAVAKVTSGTHTTYQDMSGVTLNITTKGGRLYVNFTTSITPIKEEGAYVQLMIGGVVKTVTYFKEPTMQFGSMAGTQNISLCWLEAGLAAGTYTVKIQWKSTVNQQITTAGTTTLVAMEIPA